jgi:hypothetical protein
MIVRPTMSRRVIGSPALAASLAVFAWAIGYGASGAQGTAPPSYLPPQLQALEQKMQSLRFNSERFSEITKGSVTVIDEVNGKPTGPSSQASLNSNTVNEASVSPAVGQVLDGNPRRPELIALGSTVYRHDARGQRSHQRRPWVRSRAGGESPAAMILPLQSGKGELDLGGAGSYAGLFNLLSTATAPVTADGEVSVRGQATSEFTAEVEPRVLLSGLTTEDADRFERESPIEKLQVFLTESGLPIRVVARIDAHDFDLVTTVEILAVNQPVKVKAPPARETRSARRS